MLFLRENCGLEQLSADVVLSAIITVAIVMMSAFISLAMLIPSGATSKTQQRGYFKQVAPWQRAAPATTTTTTLFQHSH